MRPRLRGAAASPRYGKGNKNKNVGFTKDEELGSEGREEVQSFGYPRPSVEGTGNTDPGKLRHSLEEGWSSDARVLCTGDTTQNRGCCSPGKLRLRGSTVAQARARSLDTPHSEPQMPQTLPRGAEWESMGRNAGGRGSLWAFPTKFSRSMEGEKTKTTLTLLLTWVGCLGPVRNDTCLFLMPSLHRCESRGGSPWWRSKQHLSQPERAGA